MAILGTLFNYPITHLRNFSHLPNLTLTRLPGAILAPGTGDCSRPTPLPITSSSIPADCASSRAARSALPRKSGTATVPPISTTTVPLGGETAAATGVAVEDTVEPPTAAVGGAGWLGAIGAGGFESVTFISASFALAGVVGDGAFAGAPASSAI